MKKKFPSIAFYCCLVVIHSVSCTPTNILISEPTLTVSVPTATPIQNQIENAACSRDELDNYLKQSDKLLIELLDDMVLAIDNPDRTAEISLVMLMVRSEYELIEPPECGITHKSLVLELMDAATGYVVNGKDPEKEASLYQKYLDKLKKATDEQDRLIHLLD